MTEWKNRAVLLKVVATPAGWVALGTPPSPPITSAKYVRKCAYFTTIVYRMRAWHLRGLLRLTDSVLLRSLHLLAGDPLHSASSPPPPRWWWWWCRCCTLSNALPPPTPLQQLPGPVLELPPPPQQQQLQLPPFATCPLIPLLTWKVPDSPFLSTIDSALSMAAAGPGWISSASAGGWVHSAPAASYDTPTSPSLVSR